MVGLDYGLEDGVETRRLEYFVQIVDAGSLNRAALVVGIAQPALSQHLSILEREFNTRLLDRSSTGVIPTDAGRTLYVRAQVILRQLASLKLELIEDAGKVAGIVTIGIPPSLGASIGAPLLAQTRALYPQLRLQVVEDGAAALGARLQSGLLDLSLSSVSLPGEALEGEALFDEDLFVMVAPALRPPSTGLADLARLPWIVPDALNVMREWLRAGFAQAQLQPNVVAEINSLPLVIRAVREGLGVTLLPKGPVSAELAEGSLLALPFCDPPLRRTISIWRRRADPRVVAVDAVRTLVVQIASAVAGPR